MPRKSSAPAEKKPRKAIAVREDPAPYEAEVVGAALRRDSSGPEPSRDKPAPTAKPSALLDTGVVYFGDNLDRLQKLPPACVDLVYIDPPFNSNRNYGVFWGEAKETRAFDDRHKSSRAYIDYMRPRCT